MKKVCVFIWVLIFVCMMLFVLFPTYANANSCIEYPTCGIVIEVNEEENLVIFQDFTGNQWSFEGTEDWCVNDICACIMNDNGTVIIYDDIIVSVRYCGWF